MIAKETPSALAPEATEYSCQYTTADTEYYLSHRRNRARDIIGRHEKCTEHQSATAELCNNIVDIKLLCSEKEHKNSKCNNVGCRNL